MGVCQGESGVRVSSIQVDIPNSNLRWGLWWEASDISLDKDSRIQIFKDVSVHTGGHFSSSCQNVHWQLPINDQHLRVKIFLPFSIITVSPSFKMVKLEMRLVPKQLILIVESLEVAMNVQSTTTLSSKDSK